MNETEAQPPRPMSLRRGLGWLAASAGLTQLVAIGAQVALGFLLSSRDFGLFAVASASAVLARGLQDAGVLDFLVRNGRERWEELAGPMFWLVLVINTLAGGSLAALAPVISRFYGEPELVGLLRILAIWFILTTPWNMYNALLRMEHRFDAIASVRTFGIVLRYAATVALAATGAGPYAFVYGLLTSAVLMGVHGYFLTRDSLVHRRPSLSASVAMLFQVRWLLVSVVSMGLMDQGDYLVLGAFASASTVGVYFFAYQLSVRIVALISTAAQTVTLPVFSGALATAVDTLRRRATTTATSLMLYTSIPSVLLAIAFPLAEPLVWGGRWDPAVLPVVIFSIAMPFQILMPVTQNYLTALGQFRSWALTALARGVGLMLTAAAASAISDSVSVFAALVSGFLAVSAIGPLTYVLGDSRGLKRSRVIWLLSRTWLIIALPCILAGVACAVVEAPIGPLWSAGACLATAASCALMLRADIALIAKPALQRLSAIRSVSPRAGRTEQRGPS